MIRPLRRAHAAIMLIVPLVVLPLLVTALRSRPAVSSPPLPAVLGSVEPLADRVRLPAMDGLPDIALFVSADGLFLDVEIADYPRSPAVVLRCAGAGSEVPVTLGALRMLRRQRFELGAPCREAGSEIVLFSSGHAAELGRSRLPGARAGEPRP